MNTKIIELRNRTKKRPYFYVITRERLGFKIVFKSAHFHNPYLTTYINGCCPDKDVKIYALKQLKYHQIGLYRTQFDNVVRQIRAYPKHIKRAKQIKNRDQYLKQRSNKADLLDELLLCPKIMQKKLDENGNNLESLFVEYGY